jgi:hypothetical protein
MNHAPLGESSVAAEPRSGDWQPSFRGIPSTEKQLAVLQFQLFRIYLGVKWAACAGGIAAVNHRGGAAGARRYNRAARALRALGPCVVIASNSLFAARIPIRTPASLRRTTSGAATGLPEAPECSFAAGRSVRRNRSCFERSNPTEQRGRFAQPRLDRCPSGRQGLGVEDLPRDAPRSGRRSVGRRPPAWPTIAQRVAQASRAATLNAASGRLGNGHDHGR